ncbi:YihY/virulence factor BrkB family protein [Pelagibacterium xiamenense]|uniref:YihY/virulence factor BrkB family protein n=1 Tax=Pelagibacterium xiamenense TaxID=2901140 RepID=UPI001E52D7C7|nr:YihY/virulence factor BrkB family protein [Pelagibacterium xiamenense]MCD7060957.1 YihY/virulence factor BrkB family protein [Pelagibacterium xiamenense]
MARTLHGAYRPTRISLSGWGTIVWRTIKAMANMDTSLRCAGVAFFGFLSIFPAVAIAVLLVGLLADPGFIDEQLQRIAAFVPEIALNVIEERLQNLINQPRDGLGLGLVISTILALWSGSRGTNALIYAAGAAYHETVDRGFVAWVLLSVGVTVGGAMFLIVSLSLVAALPAVVSFLPLPGPTDAIALVLRWPALLALAVMAFSLLYRFALGKRYARLRWIWPGALLGSLLWMIGCVLFSLYVENFGTFETSFGSLAAAVVLLLWLYNSALIFVLGATLNAEMELYARLEANMRA